VPAYSPTWRSRSQVAPCVPGPFYPNYPAECDSHRILERAIFSFLAECCGWGTAVSGSFRGMVGYAKRHRPREHPSEDQRKFLETLRNLGPRDNAQTAAVRKATKRACQVRGWVEWRCLDDLPGMRAWHLTIIGRNALNSPARPSHAIPARLPNAQSPVSADSSV
jgi:hypothetical protein